jgi:hypothetical protein
MTPYDVVPSIFHFLFLPMCEGIAIGLFAGSTLLWAMNRLESFFAQADLQRADQQVVSRCRPAIFRKLPPALPAHRLPLAKAC